MEPDAKRVRIAELERELAEATAASYDDPDSEQAVEARRRISELSAELSELLKTPRSQALEVTEPYPTVSPPVPAQRRTIPVRVIVVGLLIIGLAVALVVGLAGCGVTSVLTDDRDGDESSSVSSKPTSTLTTVPPEGALRIGGNGAIGDNPIVACNNGNLTIYGTAVFTITGHCASISSGASMGQVSVESADAVNITANETKYSISGTGTSLTVIANKNHVEIDSPVAINVTGNWNTIVYKSGSPQIVDKGVDNVIEAKK